MGEINERVVIKNPWTKPKGGKIESGTEESGGGKIESTALE